MNDNKPIKITIEQDDNKIELTTHWDSTLEDWEHIFRVILKWITFSDDMVNEFFGKNEFGEKLTDKKEKHEA